jgi:hypothetical protein
MTNQSTIQADFFGALVAKSSVLWCRIAPPLASLKEFDGGLGNNIERRLVQTTLYTLIDTYSCI